MQNGWVKIPILSLVARDGLWLFALVTGSLMIPNTDDQYLPMPQTSAFCLHVGEFDQNLGQRREIVLCCFPVSNVLSLPSIINLIYSEKRIYVAVLSISVSGLNL